MGRGSRCFLPSLQQTESLKNIFRCDIRRIVPDHDHLLVSESKCLLDGVCNPFPERVAVLSEEMIGIDVAPFIADGQHQVDPFPQPSGSGAYRPIHLAIAEGRSVPTGKGFDPSFQTFIANKEEYGLL